MTVFWCSDSGHYALKNGHQAALDKYNQDGDKSYWEVSTYEFNTEKGLSFFKYGLEEGLNRGSEFTTYFIHNNQ